MRARHWLLLTIVLVAVAGGTWWWRGRTLAPSLEGAEWGVLERGAIEVTVSATGTLQAVETVEIGTQVSGTILRLPAAANSQVRRGQVLAEIDPELLDAAIRDAEAGLARSVAQLELARSELARSERLASEGYLAAANLDPLRTAVKTAEATIVSAEATLDRAKKNRANAVIVSPIDGVVLERAVEVGQTVAASFSTPRLFLVARDLAAMQIMADVDEGDIGQVRAGQVARFTVAAYPEKSFDGVVREVRLQPKTVQNVVKYTVLVDAANPALELFPGMTATVDFVVDRADDVLTAPAAALRVRPDEALVRRREGGSGFARNGSPGGPGGEGTAAVGRQASRRDRQARAGAPGSERPAWGGANGRPGGGPGAGPGGERPRDVAVLYLRSADGLALEPRPVRTGLADGRRTAIIPLGPPLEAGTEVLVAVPGATPVATSSSNQRPPRGFRMF